MPKRLTPRQLEVLEAIRDSVRQRGLSPTVRELGDRLKIGSTNAVIGHLVALERKGWIVRDPMLSRSIRLTEEFVEKEREILKRSWVIRSRVQPVYLRNGKPAEFARSGEFATTHEINEAKRFETAEDAAAALRDWGLMLSFWRVVQVEQSGWVEVGNG